MFSILLCELVLQIWIYQDIIAFQKSKSPLKCYPLGIFFSSSDSDTNTFFSYPCRWKIKGYGCCTQTYPAKNFPDLKRVLPTYFFVCSKPIKFKVINKYDVRVV